MSISIEELGIDRLSVAQRLDLVERIWDSLPESREPDEIPDWHRAESAALLDDANARPGKGKPWREVVGVEESDR